MGERNVGVAMDFSACSKAALRWASTNMVRGGDRLVLLHVNSSYQVESGIVHLWEQDGSRMLTFLFFVFVLFCFVCTSSFYRVSMNICHSIEVLKQIITYICSALIPLYEFSDPLIAKRYGVAPDKETLDILARVANQRQVCSTT